MRVCVRVCVHACQSSASAEADGGNRARAQQVPAVLTHDERALNTVDSTMRRNETSHVRGSRSFRTALNFEYAMASRRGGLPPSLSLKSRALAGCRRMGDARGQRVLGSKCSVPRGQETLQQARTNERCSYARRQATGFVWRRL